MALTATEETLLRDLLAKQAQLIALANNETTITAKLGSTKATIDDLTAATTVADADLMIVRQGGVDKKMPVSVVKSDLVDLSSYAPLASPALTGTPTAPTAPAGTNTTQIATTEFVQTATNTQPSITGSATLNGTISNKVLLTDIVTTLGLEVGDVIRIQCSGYNKLHTVEYLEGINTIVVNFAHAGNQSNGRLRLPDTTATATITRIAKWYNAPNGLGQEWVDVAASRSRGTTYTNTSGRPLTVSIVAGQGRDSYADIYVNEVMIFSQRDTYDSTHPQSSATGVVPHLSTYKSVPTSLKRWMELR